MKLSPMARRKASTRSRRRAYEPDARGADALNRTDLPVTRAELRSAIGVMQLTMEPLDEMLASARVDGRGRDGHDLARRGVPVVAQARDGGALVDGRLGADGARDGAADDRLGDHLAVHAASRCRWRWTRASSRRRPGPGRFLLGFGTSKIFLNNARLQTKKTLGPMRDAVDDRPRRARRRGVRVRGRHVERRRARRSRTTRTTPRDVPPVYVAATAPKMQALAGEIARRLPDAVDHDARPSSATRARTSAPTSTSAARSSPRSTSPIATRGRDGAREIAGMYLANKVQNIQGSADTLLDLAGARAGRDPARRRGDGAGRPARGEGEGDRRDPRQVQADRGHARPTASRRSRSTARPAARTSCSSSGATRGTSRSALFGEEVLPHFRRELRRRRHSSRLEADSAGRRRPTARTSRRARARHATSSPSRSAGRSRQRGRGRGVLDVVDRLGIRGRRRAVADARRTRGLDRLRGHARVRALSGRARRRVRPGDVDRTVAVRRTGSFDACQRRRSCSCTSASRERRRLREAGARARRARRRRRVHRRGTYRREDAWLGVLARTRIVRRRGRSPPSPTCQPTGAPVSSGSRDEARRSSAACLERRRARTDVRRCDTRRASSLGASGEFA